MPQQRAREYGILEAKFPDGGHCQSVLRRQWVLFTQCQGIRHLRIRAIPFKNVGEGGGSGNQFKMCL